LFEFVNLFVFWCRYVGASDPRNIGSSLEVVVSFDRLATVSLDMSQLSAVVTLDKFTSCCVDFHWNVLACNVVPISSSACPGVGPGRPCSSSDVLEVLSIIDCVGDSVIGSHEREVVPELRIEPGKELLE